MRARARCVVKQVGHRVCLACEAVQVTPQIEIWPQCSSVVATLLHLHPSRDYGSSDASHGLLSLGVEYFGCPCSVRSRSPALPPDISGSGEALVPECCRRALACLIQREKRPRDPHMFPNSAYRTWNQRASRAPLPSLTRRYTALTWVCVFR